MRKSLQRCKKDSSSVARVSGVAPTIRVKEAKNFESLHLLLKLNSRYVGGCAKFNNRLHNAHQSRFNEQAMSINRKLLLYKNLKKVHFIKESYISSS